MPSGHDENHRSNIWTCVEWGQPFQSGKVILDPLVEESFHCVSPLLGLASPSILNQFVVNESMLSIDIVAGIGYHDNGWAGSSLPQRDQVLIDGVENLGETPTPPHTVTDLTRLNSHQGRRITPQVLPEHFSWWGTRPCQTESPPKPLKSLQRRCSLTSGSPGHLTPRMRRPSIPSSKEWSAGDNGLSFSIAASIGFEAATRSRPWLPLRHFAPQRHTKQFLRQAVPSRVHCPHDDLASPWPPSPPRQRW